MDSSPLQSVPLGHSGLRVRHWLAAVAEIRRLLRANAFASAAAAVVSFRGRRSNEEEPAEEFDEFEEGEEEPAEELPVARFALRPRTREALHAALVALAASLDTQTTGGDDDDAAQAPSGWLAAAALLGGSVGVANAATTAAAPCHGGIK